MIKMHCPYYVNDLCYNDLPKSTIEKEYFSDNVKKIGKVCLSKKYGVCPRVKK
jgi:hypothetical protein